VAARRGEHAESERLLGAAAAAHREAGSLFERSVSLAETSWYTHLRGEHRLALERLREALWLSREIGSGDRMRWSVHIAVGVLWARRPGEAARVHGEIEG